MSGDLHRLDGRVALVTGAAGGIGRATAALLIERGATLVMTDASHESSTSRPAWGRRGSCTT